MKRGAAIPTPWCCRRRLAHSSAHRRRRRSTLPSTTPRPRPPSLAGFHVPIRIPPAFIPSPAIPTRSFLFLPPAARPSATPQLPPPTPTRSSWPWCCPCCLLVPRLLLLPARSRPQLCAWLSLHNLFCVGSRKGVPGLERSGEAGTPFLKARRRAKSKGASGQQGVQLGVHLIDEHLQVAGGPSKCHRLRRGSGMGFDWIGHYGHVSRRAMLAPRQVRMRARSPSWVPAKCAGLAR
jgi:hypothetical protein